MSSPSTHEQILEATKKTRATMTLQNVPVNMYESSASIVLVAPFPTVQPEDVIVELYGNKLRIFGELRSAGTRQYILQEWKYGGYEREIELPSGFGAGIEASLCQGQLAVRVLRGEPAAEPIKIQPNATAIRMD